MTSHHERHKQCARRFDVFRHIERDRDRNCRYTSSFNGTLDQRDALMADRSGGGKQGDVRHFRFDRIGYVLGQRFFKPLGVHVVTDERKEIVR